MTHDKTDSDSRKFENRFYKSMKHNETQYLLYSFRLNLTNTSTLTPQKNVMKSVTINFITRANK